MSKPLGRHLLVELYGCDRRRLDDLEFLKAQSVAASQAMGATVVGVHAHRFQPVGVSIVVVLSESHLALHTWPEHATASVDIFVCSPTIDPRLAQSALAHCLGATGTADLEIQRGNLREDRPERWHYARQPTRR